MQDRSRGGLKVIKAASTTGSKRWHGPWVVALVALAVRALYLLLAAREPTFLSPGMDAEIYRNWADAILAGNPPEGPFFRAPLYPWLISALGYIFNDTFWPIRIVQILASSVRAGILAILACRWMGRRAGWIAGLTWALYGASVYFDGEGLIVSLFTSGLIMTLLLIDNSARRHWLLYTFLLAVQFAALTLLRANALAYAPVILLALWWSGRVQKVRVPIRAASLAGAALLALVLLFPVMRYNAEHGAGWTISGQGGINLFLGNRTGASGAYAVDPDYGPDWTEAQIERRAATEAGHSISTAEVSAYYTRAALEFWVDHPGEAILLSGRKALALVNWRELGNNRPLWPYLWHTSPLHAVLLAIGFPLVAIIGLAFVVPAWREIPRLRPALLLALMQGLVVVAFFVNARYRFPLAPVLVLLFAFGANRLLPDATSQPVAKPAWRARIIALAVLALVVLLPRPIAPINTDESWQLHQANALLRLGRYSEAASSFQVLMADYPDARNVYLNLGVIYLRQGLDTEARQFFEMELTQRPDNALAWNNIGVLDEQAGDLDDAISAYRKSLLADPAHEDARANLLRLLTREAASSAEAGDLEEALRYTHEALTLSPGQSRYRYNYAVLLAAARRTSAAKDSLNAILADDPGFELARDALSRLSR